MTIVRVLEGEMRETGRAMSVYQSLVYGSSKHMLNFKLAAVRAKSMAIQSPIHNDTTQGFFSVCAKLKHQIIAGWTSTIPALVWMLVLIQRCANTQNSIMRWT